MSAALSPEPEEPYGSGLPGNTDEGMPQGLYVTAPAEDLSLEGFAADGRADTMAPGPLLAMVLDTAAGPDGAGLAGLSDDQLIGFLSGARRMESRLAAGGRGDRVRPGGGAAAPGHLRRAGGGEARRGPRQDHRGRHQHLVRRGRRRGR
ncbi:MAG: hypothetical protein ABSB59_39325 [Streptosporangiaceae bacterium]